MKNNELRGLCDEICKKAFHWTPPRRIRLRFKRMKKDLGWVRPYGNRYGSEGATMRMHNGLRFSRTLTGACLIHEIAHLVSGSHGHGDKFYKCFFKAAQTKYGRQFF
jgi:hypothetical protein